MTKYSLKKAKEGDIIVSMYYGVSEPIRLLGDGFYIIAAYFPEAEIEIMYTENGVPNWESAGDKEQTAFLQSDIEKLEFNDFDFSALIPKEQMVTENDINAYGLIHLEVRTKIGMWRDASLAPLDYINYAKKEKLYHLFRKAMW